MKLNFVLVNFENWLYHISTPWPCSVTNDNLIQKLRTRSGWNTANKITYMVYTTDTLRRRSWCCWSSYLPRRSLVWTWSKWYLSQHALDLRRRSLRKTNGHKLGWSTYPRNAIYWRDVPRAQEHDQIRHHTNAANLLQRRPVFAEAA